MNIRKWDDLPDILKTREVRKYYDALKKKTFALFWKRVFDIIASFFMIVFFAPIFLLISIAIKCDSSGPVFYRQVRITQYGKPFRIFKFRSMVTDADKKGSLITVDHDSRITGVGNFLRKTKIDEMPQVFNILTGDMSFVGTRPEVPKYVDQYTPEMMATLLLPAGITSLASIYYKDENSLLEQTDDVDTVYMEKILPDKMKWNLRGLLEYSFFGDIKLMFMTFFAACGKNYNTNEVDYEKTRC